LNFFYNFFIHLGKLGIHIAALWNSKLQLFVKGRTDVISQINQLRDPQKKLLWVHVASLGEYEQGRPVIKAFKRIHPEAQVLLSVFSPSAYQVIKSKKKADILVYLPIDTKQNAKRFIAAAKPTAVVFIKYEIWPNFLNEIDRNSIPSFLVSAIFRSSQIYFKRYGSFFRNTLKKFDHIFTQDEQSIQLLKNINYTSCSIGGDTRFDRVQRILATSNHLSYLDQFKKDSKCLIFGSSWPEDEAIYIPYINESKRDLKYIIAPHKIDQVHIEELERQIKKKCIRFSKMHLAKNLDADVFILDTIGLLTKAYAHADIAYIGGGFKTGLHNTLEAAVFGIPILIGPQYSKFKEAVDLVKLGGIEVVQTKAEFAHGIDYLLDHQDQSNERSHINKSYVEQHTGAADKAMKLINDLFS